MTSEAEIRSERRRARPWSPALLFAVGGSLAFGCEVDGRPLVVVSPTRPPPGMGFADAAAPPPPPRVVGPSSLPDAGPVEMDGACNAGQAAPQCAAVRCPPDDVCRNYVPSIQAGTCVAPGRCASAADCSLTWTAAARAGEACSCEGGRCALILGERCTTGTDCQTGSCVTGAGAGATSVCCIRDCASTEVCAAGGATCVPAPVCTNGDRRCSGSNYQICAAGQWTLEAACGAMGCDVAQGGCAAAPTIPSVSAASLCTDACVLSFLVANGECNDGRGAGDFYCDLGTDCIDCGTSASGCTNTCSVPEYNADGVCDDGGADAVYALCDLGTDCTDCGDRAP